MKGLHKEKAAAAGTATASIAPMELNTVKVHTSTPAKECQGIDVQKLFWKGVWGLFRDRNEALAALEVAKGQAESDIAAAERAVTGAKADRQAAPVASEGDLNRLAALELAGLLADEELETAKAALEAQIQTQVVRAGRMVGLCKGRLTRTRRKVEAIVMDAATAVAQLDGRLATLQAAGGDLYEQVEAAWEATKIRKAADRAARTGDIVRAKELLAQALEVNPENDDNARYYQRTRAEIARVERRVERVRVLADLSGRMNAAVAAGSVRDLSTLERTARKAGVYDDQLAQKLNRAKQAARAEADRRTQETKNRVAILAKALQNQGASGRTAIIPSVGEIKVYVRAGKGFVLTETHHLNGKGWKRVNEPGNVVVTNIPVSGRIV